jgi:O-antigen/teichoic acid export membrane protein
LSPFLPEFKEGFYFSVSTSTQSVYNDIDKTILSMVNSTSVAGVYSAAYKIINFLFLPINSLMYSAYPRFFKEGNHGIKRSTKWAMKLQPFTMLYGFLVIIVLVVGSRFIPLVLGSSYLETSQVLIWLSPLILLKSLHCFPVMH